MKRVKQIAMRGVLTLVMTAVTLVPTLASANTVEERPSPTAMAADAVLVRPLMLAGTGMGLAIYVFSLPMSLMGGNAEEAGRKMVITPFKATFIRCLGCTRKHAPDSDYY